MKRFIVPGLAALAFVGCAAHQTTAVVIKVMPPIPGTCHAEFVDNPESDSMVVAQLTCSDGIGGDDCWTQLRQKACAVGGDAILGAHWEPTGALVGTVVKLAGPSVTERMITRGPKAE